MFYFISFKKVCLICELFYYKSILIVILLHFWKNNNIFIDKIKDYIYTIRNSKNKIMCFKNLGMMLYVFERI